MDPSDTEATRAPRSDEGSRGVARNALHLLLAQVMTSVVAFVVTMAIARHLGPEAYGVMFLATAFVSLALVLVDFGQSYFSVSAIARSPASAGTMLTTGIALRVGMGAVLLPPVWGLAALLGYPARTQAAILATFAFLLVTSLGAGLSAVLRGLERMDLDAICQVTIKLSYGVSTLIAVALGAGLLGVIAAQGVGAAAGLAVCAILVRRLEFGCRRVDRGVAIELIRGGWPFLLWSAIVAAHSTFDSLILSQLATDRTVGWYGAASRLTAILTLPAGVVAAALFPTLSRLFVRSPAEFRRLTADALRGAVYAGGLFAGGGGVFAARVVGLVYGDSGFDPAADILRVSSIFLFGLFLNFVLGTAVMAANRHKPWIAAKGVAVAVLVALDLLLIPATEVRFGNGGVGAAIGTGLAEVGLLAVALVLAPSGILDRRLVGAVARSGAGVIAIALVAHGTASQPVLLGIALSATAYVGVVGLLGGVTRTDVNRLSRTIRQRER